MVFWTAGIPDGHWRSPALGTGRAAELDAVPLAPPLDLPWCFGWLRSRTKASRRRSPALGSGVAGWRLLTFNVYLRDFRDSSVYLRRGVFIDNARFNVFQGVVIVSESVFQTIRDVHTLRFAQGHAAGAELQSLLDAAPLAQLLRMMVTETVCACIYYSQLSGLME